MKARLLLLIPLSVLGAATCFLILMVSMVVALGIQHDTDPQAFEANIEKLLGVQQGEPFSFGVEKTWRVEDPQGRMREVESVVKPFYIEYWNGNQVLFYIPEGIWDATFQAYTKYPWCDPRVVSIVGHSESPVYRNYDSENRATAMGVWQFIRTTWYMMWPNPINRPERTDIYASADAACRYLRMTGSLDSLAKGEEAFVRAFAVTPPVWNRYPPQAEYVYQVWERLDPWSVIPESPHADPNQPKQVSSVWWRKFLVTVFTNAGLLPETLAYNSSVPVPFPSTADEYFILPYKGNYTITWDLHGQDYGHCAIDIAEGLGTFVYSPINGVVTQKYTDGFGNTVLEIQNSEYEVKLLHGVWVVSRGQELEIGQFVGFESNIGNTWTKRGGRWIKCGALSFCGYHTHFSAFRKSQPCVDPRELVNPPPDEPRR